MDLKIFDVEHGACALLTCDNGARLMIDCGHNASTGWKPGDYLAKLGTRYLEMLAITNYDEDHVSGLPNLRSKVYIDWILRNPTVSSDALKLLKSETGMGPGMEALADVISGLGYGQKAEPTFQGVQWHAFWNNYPFFDDENNLSMVLYLSINGTGFLFPGDLETAGWNNLLNTSQTFRDIVKKVDVLVASHHGRESGICSHLFDKHGCKPHAVVISDDYHQYDTQKTTSYYQAKCWGFDGFRGQGKRWVLTTRDDEEITFTFSAQGCFAS